MAESHKRSDSGSSTYLCAPYIRWAVEADGIILIDQKNSNVKKLAYPQVAVWYLITQGYSNEKSVRMLSSIAGMEFAKAGFFLIDCIEEWTEAGFLIKEKDNG